ATGCPLAGGSAPARPSPPHPPARPTTTPPPRWRWRSERTRLDPRALTAPSPPRRRPIDRHHGRRVAPLPPGCPAAVAVSCGSTLTSLTRDHCRYGDHMSGLVVPRKTEPSHTDPSMSALSVAWHDPYRAE